VVIASGDLFMPDPQKLLSTIRRASELFRATPGRTGSVVSLDDAEDVLVVGDLHGHIETFARVLKIAALDRNPARHLVLQELVHDPRADPDVDVDRSHRLVDLVAALKCQYPARVHFLLGNHELSELTGRSISKNGVYLNALFQLGIEAAYGNRSGEIRQAYLELFASLPLAVRTPNRVFLCHTVPEARDLEKLDAEIFASEVWPPASLLRGGAVYALTWGRDTSPETADEFARLVDADLFVIGHHPCDDGFLRANHRVLILDGTDPHPAYCQFPANRPVTLDDLLRGVRIIPLVS
jgi:Calcineurin-like phosphoesterase